MIIELDAFHRAIEACETTVELNQFLGSIYAEYLTSMSKPDEVNLDELTALGHVLHKYAKKTSAVKAFVCGDYYSKFNRMKEDCIEMMIEQKRVEMLSRWYHRDLFTFLFMNGCCDSQKIQDAFPGKDIAAMMEQFVDLGLASCTILPEVTYYELTAQGYAYHSKTIGRWER